MILKSYAKINLFLEILRKNEKNYHILESLICFLNIFDLIKIEKNNKFYLEFSGEYGSFLTHDPNENIISKIVNFMAKKFNFVPNLKISLEKNIPIGAGMGGGSSNGATIILALNQIFKINLKYEEMTEIGAKFGCDIPVCLNDKIAFIEGCGEKVTPINLLTKPLWAVIVNPKNMLSTKEVFTNFKIKKERKGLAIVPGSDLVTTIQNRQNDLEETAIQMMQEIGLILNEIEKQKNCLVSRMSGSGSTCFGLFENETDLENSFLNLQKRFPDFYLKKSPLIYKKIN